MEITSLYRHTPSYSSLFIGFQHVRGEGSCYSGLYYGRDTRLEDLCYAVRNDGRQEANCLVGTKNVQFTFTPLIENIGS